MALLLRPTADEIELLLIKRAEFPGDPWSGHMALPGGHREENDPDPLHTALREVREEVGICLSRENALGSLDDAAPATEAFSMVISPYVFAAPPGATATPNAEVEAAVWIPLSELAHPGAATEHLLEMTSGNPRRFPAIGTRGYVIWGLTHRILVHFLDIAFARGTHGR